MFGILFSVLFTVDLHQVLKTYFLENISLISDPPKTFPGLNLMNNEVHILIQSFKYWEEDQMCSK